MVKVVIDFDVILKFQSIILKCQIEPLESPKCQFGTLECTLEEIAVLNLISKDTSITQKKLVEETGKSTRTIKRVMASLQERGSIRRIDGKRFGKWEVLVEIK